MDVLGEVEVLLGEVLEKVGELGRRQLAADFRILNLEIDNKDKCFRSCFYEQQRREPTTTKNTS